MRDELDQRPATFEMLAEHFCQTFPQLDGVRFTHRWGGAIDTSTRFFAFQRTALGGRVAYSVGYTGLGVGASAFGARVMLDLLPAAAARRWGSRRPLAGRCRSRPSRCAWPASSSPAARWPGPTGTPAGAGPGCACSTGSGLGFDS